MKKLIIGFIIGFLLGGSLTVFANPSFIGENAIWNRIFNSSTDTINVILN